MGEEILEQAREIKLLLLGRERVEKWFLQKSEHPLVGEKVAKKKSGKEHEKAPDKPCLEFI